MNAPLRYAVYTGAVLSVPATVSSAVMFGGLEILTAVATAIGAPIVIAVVYASANKQQPAQSANTHQQLRTA